MSQKTLHIKTTEQKILKFIDQHKLIAENDYVLLGLSGGIDSVFALHFLIKYKNRFNINVSAVHINHGLRGTESDADQKFCEKLCEQLNVKLFTETVDVNQESRQKNISTEEAARNLRYNVYGKIAKENNCTKVITAHNLNDNSETVLLNLLKGSGIKGLSGIPIQRGNIIRPFLCVSRDEITGYCEQENLEYRIDSSNDSNDFERNFLRNEILTRIMERFGDSVHENISRTSGHLKSLNTFLLNNSEIVSKNYVTRTENGIEIKNELFNENEIVCGSVLMNLFYTDLKIEFTHDDFKHLSMLSKAQTGKTVHLKDDWAASSERGKIVICKNEDAVFKEMEIHVGEHVEYGKLLIGIDSVVKDDFQLSEDDFTEYIDADNLGDIFILRKWNPGDRFQPLGMTDSKKVSDFLTEQKISSVEKASYPVMINNNNIIWIPGLRINERCKITESTKKVLKLWLKNRK